MRVGTPLHIATTTNLFVSKFVPPSSVPNPRILTATTSGLIQCSNLYHDPSQYYQFYSPLSSRSDSVTAIACCNTGGVAAVASSDGSIIEYVSNEVAAAAGGADFIRYNEVRRHFFLHTVTYVQASVDLYLPPATPTVPSTHSLLALAHPSGVTIDAFALANAYIYSDKEIYASTVSI